MFLRSPRLCLLAKDDETSLRAALTLTAELIEWDIDAVVWRLPQAWRTGSSVGHGPTDVQDVGSVESLIRLTPVEDPTYLQNGGDVTILIGGDVRVTDAGEHASRQFRTWALGTKTPVVWVTTGEAQASGMPPDGNPWIAGSLRLEVETKPAGTGATTTASPASPPTGDPVDTYVVGGTVRSLSSLLTIAGRALFLASPNAWGGAAREAYRPLPANGSRTTRHPKTTNPRTTKRARGRALMVAGTHSNAGKTFITTLLARYFAMRGLAVAPFKGQNMSNNARIVSGGEIGVAQYLQAQAAGVQPDVRMNPVLIKPHTAGSQVIVMGKPWPDVSSLPWRIRKPIVWDQVRMALRSLLGTHDLVLIEGAGSPAEVHLYRNDIVNMRVAAEADASVVLVTDAGRGGAIAHVLGTWQLLPPRDRGRLRGYIFNRFYPGGNPALFDAGIRFLEEATGVPSLGVLPELAHGLPDEDRYGLQATDLPASRFVVAVVAYPFMSNFDEFAPLKQMEGVAVKWAQDPNDLRGADLIILPGSRDVGADLSWMKRRGMDAAVVSAGNSNRRVLGICGGLQILGLHFHDETGVEGSGNGLGLLPLTTQHKADKIQRMTVCSFADLPTTWQALEGLSFKGYEIRHGRSAPSGAHKDAEDLAEVLPGGLGFARNNVLGVYAHGMLEDECVARALVGGEREARTTPLPTLDQLVDRLREHVDMTALEELVMD